MTFQLLTGVLADLEDYYLILSDWKIYELSLDSDFFILYNAS